VWWILLLQEFDITIKDKKGTENVIANDLSRLTIDSTSDITQINYYFPDESLLSISTMPWFANIVNFLNRRFASSLEYLRQKKVFERSEIFLLG
jgi:hypothetical protein